MNDFTKEELELFLYYEEQADGQSPLYEKLQSMIDNYCKHKQSVYGPCSHCNKFHESSVDCIKLNLR